MKGEKSLYWVEGMVAMESYGIGCKVVTKKSNHRQTSASDRVIRDY